MGIRIHDILVRIFLLRKTSFLGDRCVACGIGNAPFSHITSRTISFNCPRIFIIMVEKDSCFLSLQTDRTLADFLCRLCSRSLSFMANWMWICPRCQRASSYSFSHFLLKTNECILYIEHFSRKICVPKFILSSPPFPVINTLRCCVNQHRLVSIDRSLLAQGHSALRTHYSEWSIPCAWHMCKDTYPSL